MRLASLVAGWDASGENGLFSGTLKSYTAPLGTCSICTTGTYLNWAAQTCDECPNGKYADDEGLATCSSCPAGKFDSKPSQGSTSSDCVPCDAGKFNEDPGQTSCEVCDAGKVSIARRLAYVTIKLITR